ncbi:MAG: 50S ribosomal protein L21 [Nitrospirota bacterium]|nr:50S ribosomal protein L21 [Nitrospirota bacterium]
MYAVIEAGGQQHKVSAGDTVKVHKLATGSEKEISFDKVLLVSKDDEIFLGNPYIENASVKAEVEGDVRSAKTLVFKQKPRKGYRRLKGHRQDYTVLKIKDIVYGG